MPHLSCSAVCHHDMVKTKLHDESFDFKRYGSSFWTCSLHHTRLYHHPIQNRQLLEFRICLLLQRHSTTAPNITTLNCRHSYLTYYEKKNAKTRLPNTRTSNCICGLVQSIYRCVRRSVPPRNIRIQLRSHIICNLLFHTCTNGTLATREQLFYIL